MFSAPTTKSCLALVLLSLALTASPASTAAVVAQADQPSSSRAVTLETSTHLSVADPDVELETDVIPCSGSKTVTRESSPHNACVPPRDSVTISVKQPSNTVLHRCSTNFENKLINHAYLKRKFWYSGSDAYASVSNSADYEICYSKFFIRCTYTLTFDNC